VQLGQRLANAPDRHAELKRGLLAIYLRRLREHGCELNDTQVENLLAMDLELNAQGMEIWLSRNP
jgi:hypothetical protein